MGFFEVKYDKMKQIRKMKEVKDNFPAIGSLSVESKHLWNLLII